MKIKQIAGALILSAYALSCAADVTVYWRQSETSAYVDISTASDVTVSTGTVPDITLGNRGGQYWILADEVSPGVRGDLGVITFTQGAGPAGVTSTLFITADNNPTLSQLVVTPGASDLEGVDQTTELVTLLSSNSGDILDDITCDVIRQMLVNGNVLSTSLITHQSTKNDQIESIRVTNGDFEGSLVAADGDIAEFRVIDGSFTGALFLRKGFLTLIEIEDGNFSGILGCGLGPNQLADGIDTIRITGGDFLSPGLIGGHLVSGIDLIQVEGAPNSASGGKIGSPTALVNIGGTASRLTRIGSIVCEQLHANVNVLGVGLAGSSIEQITVSGDPDGNFDGDWSGSLFTGKIANLEDGLVFVDGECTADIEASLNASDSPIVEFENDGGFPGGTQWLSNDGLDSGTLVRFADGLGGQVILAADPLPAATPIEDWDGAVEILLSDSVVHEFSPSQSQPYQAPFYHALSSQLGGGAVGLVPFNFHQWTSAPPAGESYDCDPHQEEYRSVPFGSSLDTATISHYGPVWVDETEGEPYFRVEFRLSGRQPWQDRTSLFEVDTTQTGTSSTSTNRDVIIQGTSANPDGFKATGHWRIRPLAGKVKCAQVPDSPDVEYDSDIEGPDAGTSSPSYDWYFFRVHMFTSGGMSLLTNDTVTMSDVAVWPDEPFETNADGTTDNNDLLNLIQALDD